jgi:hypothetical protein
MIGGASAAWAGSGGAPPANAADATEHGSGAGTTSNGWPLVSALPPLAALPTAPACARGHVRAVAREWGLSDLVNTAEFVASELVTNAIQASERLVVRADLAIVPVIRLWLTCEGAVLAIHVWDGSDEMPVRRDAGPQEISGRGLMIIDSLAKDWGSYRKAGGKVVWAVIAREAVQGAGGE